MKAVIIASDSFVGPYLIRAIEKQFVDIQIVGTYLKKENTEKLAELGIETTELDILNESQVHQFLSDQRPDYLVNLAAQSSVGFSWKDPSMTFRVNVIGTINILHCIRTLELETKVLLIGSSEEYFPSLERLSEDDRVYPTNPYGVSKMAQEYLGKLYNENFDYSVVLTRSFNHTGPGQLETFVIPDWCNQIAKIEKGLQEPVVNTGNISIERDISHVADIVEDYAILLRDGSPGNVYNVGSGIPTSLESILRILISFSPVDIEIVVDSFKVRPNDNSILYCDRSRTQAVTGTRYRSIEETLLVTLDYWRSRYK